MSVLSWPGLDPRTAQTYRPTTHRESALAETGDLIIPIQQGLFSADRIHAELGEIVASTKLGRQSTEEVTFFKSVGLAVQDAAAAAAALKKAEELGLGTVVGL